MKDSNAECSLSDIGKNVRMASHYVFGKIDSVRLGYLIFKNGIES